MKITFNKVLGAVMISFAMSACAQGPAQGGEPVLNVDPARHGNLASAQQLVRQAYDKLTAAQQANRGELGGHAARAKELLRQANDEIKQAALAANQR